MVQVRVHCSIQYKVAVVISWNSGDVRDCEVLNKYYSACSCWEGHDRISEKYSQWHNGHKDLCLWNYTGCLPPMEAKGVHRLWQRSVSRLGLWYMQVIYFQWWFQTYATLSDNKTLSWQTDRQVWVFGEVQKRVGKYLRKLKKDKTLKHEDSRRPVFTRCLNDANSNEPETYTIVIPYVLM